MQSKINTLIILLIITLPQIADFGMSRDLMDESYYVSHGGMIPVKWTAPEVCSCNSATSLRPCSKCDRLLTTRSTPLLVMCGVMVWSCMRYGVLDDNHSKIIQTAR